MDEKRRFRRFALIAFIVVVLLYSYDIHVNNLITSRLYNDITSSLSTIATQQEVDDNSAGEVSSSFLPQSAGGKIQIFYNLFIDEEISFDRVESYVREQLQHMKPELHNDNVIINFLGYRPENNMIAGHQKLSTGSKGMKI